MASKNQRQHRSNQKLFERFFGSNEIDGEVNLNSAERSVAQLIYTLSSRKIHEDQKDAVDDPDDEPSYDPDDEPSYDPDDDPGDSSDDDDALESFDQPIEAAMKNFKRAVELFKLSSCAKDAFLEKFDPWSTLRKKTIQHLKEIADQIQTDKYNSDIAKVVGSSVCVAGGVLFGLSFIPPLALVTVPLAITGGIAAAVGGVVAAGTEATEHTLLGKKVEEAKNLIKQDMENFSLMSGWFDHTNELKKALENLINWDLLNEMSEDLDNFHNELKVQKNPKVDFLKNGFIKVLTDCVEKMSKHSKIKDLFGVDFAPIVMTFLTVVCLMRDDNRKVLDSVVQINSKFDGGQMGMVSLYTSLIPVVGIAFNILNIVKSSIDLHNRPKTEHASKIKEVFEKLDDQLSFIKSVYDELKNWESIDRTNVTIWKSFIISQVPLDSLRIDIKLAIKPHLPEEAWSCIKLQKYPGDGNNWLAKVPARQSQMLVLQSHLNINGEMCQVRQWTRWKTFLLHNIPYDAGQEDIKMGVRPHLPEAAWDSIKLQRLSTEGNIWLVKIPDAHSPNLRQQLHIIIKGELCLFTQ